MARQAGLYRRSLSSPVGGPALAGQLMPGGSRWARCPAQGLSALGRRQLGATDDLGDPRAPSRVVRPARRAADLPAGYPLEYRRVVTLRDGRRVLIRSGQTDEAAIRLSSRRQEAPRGQPLLLSAIPAGGAGLALIVSCTYPSVACQRRAGLPVRVPRSAGPHGRPARRAYGPLVSSRIRSWGSQVSRRVPSLRSSCPG